uniref:Uncharacterized protein n=1 Tax=uncultured marine bacterium 561 TaxID=257396 RepID=Q6SGD9_9BACT|nr:hypothetical protein MBMO_EBAC000-47H08.2 [uncultured marine bacterium 561]
MAGSSDMDKVGFSADLPIANDTGNVAPVPKLRHSNEAQSEFEFNNYKKTRLAHDLVVRN